jgi:hypothetical protein
LLQESFLEDINCILNSGEVPDLFDNEELDGITMDLKNAAAEADVPDTRASVYQFFIQRVGQGSGVRASVYQFFIQRVGRRSGVRGQGLRLPVLHPEGRSGVRGQGSGPPSTSSSSRG